MSKEQALEELLKMIKEGIDILQEKVPVRMSIPSFLV